MTASSRVLRVVLFALFDVDQDGFISHDDLHEVFRLMVGETVTEDQLEVMISTTLKQLHADSAGKVSPEAFVKVRGGGGCVYRNVHKLRQPSWQDCTAGDCGGAERRQVALRADACAHTLPVQAVEGTSFMEELSLPFTRDGEF